MTAFDINQFRNRTKDLIQNYPGAHAAVRAYVTFGVAHIAFKLGLSEPSPKKEYRALSEQVKLMDLGVHTSVGNMASVLDLGNYLMLGTPVPTNPNETQNLSVDLLNVHVSKGGTQPAQRLALFLADRGTDLKFTAQYAADFIAIENWFRGDHGYVHWLHHHQLVSQSAFEYTDKNGANRIMDPDNPGKFMDALKTSPLDPKVHEILCTWLDATLRPLVPHLNGFSLPIVTGTGGKQAKRTVSVPSPNQQNVSASAPSEPMPEFPTTQTTQPQESTTNMNPNLDLASLMSDPAKLGEFMGSAILKIGEIPKLVARATDAEAKAKQIHDMLHVEMVAKNAARDEVARLNEEALELKKKLNDAMSNVTAPTKPSEQGKGNDLDAIARALRIDRPLLEQELTAFTESCVSPLPNKVRWPSWCNPADPTSLLPFTYKHGKPVFLAGESGTGKTFIAEALAMKEDGRRCAVTFHEKISYAKLFMRETVNDGKVRGVLGPVLLSMLTGTPLILDEIDHADVFVQSLMHEALDKRQVFIPELACMIRCEPSCKFIATGNSLTDDSGQYHGEVGTALRTRFAAIHVEYPNQSDEADTVRTASDCDQGTADTIAKTFAALRSACIEQKLTGPISVRESCAVGKLYVQAKGDKIKHDAALGMALKLMVVDKRPRGEQAVASEIIAATTNVAVSSMTQAAGA